MTDAERIYSFVLRGLLTDQALDTAGRRSRPALDVSTAEISNTLSIDALPADLVHDAEQMAVVYTAVATFENAVRELIAGVLLESKGEGWWQNCVAQKIRDRAEKRREDERRVKWHTQRGVDPINYTTMADLVNIIRNNWDIFEPHFRSLDWVANVFDVIERSRNVIMHSGVLEKGDIERLGIFIRDWIKQVGT